MNKKFKARSKAFIASLCAIAICSTNITVLADDSVDKLERQTNQLQGQLSSLNSQLDSLSSKITGLASQIEDTNASLEKARLDLAAAKLNEEMQYDAMKKRIKYMYEAGNASLIQMIFSSESMGEFLNKTEFVKNVTEYDREMLEELQAIHEEVEKKEEALLKEQEQLEALKSDLNNQRQSLNQAISSTNSKLSASADALQKAKNAQKAAQDVLNPNTNSSGNSSSNTNKPAVSTPAQTNDLVLFAAILQCEAGSTNYNALLAVATVIMNRVESSRYPNTLQGVIYQKGQFSPTWNGSLSRVLSRGPASLCYKVAQDALGGARLASVRNCYSFRASWTGHYGVNVGGNVFF